MATNEATIGALTQAVTLALADKIELEQGVTPSNSSKYGELGQVYDLFNTERGTVGTLSVVSGTATADLLSGRRSFFKMTIGANFTLALSNVPAGASFLCVQFTTNSTGGYGVTLPAAFHAMAGSGAAVITTANVVCYLRAYTVDGGVNWYYIIDAGDAGGGGGGTGPTNANCLHVNDTKTTGTNGGNAAVGANTRTLNTVVLNTISGASLASNQITLPAGTYYIEASAPCYRTDRSRVYLYNVTDSANQLLGTNSYSSTSSQSAVISQVIGYFTIAATKTFQLRHFCTAALTSLGLGIAVSDGNPEVYTDIFIWKL